ncbi:methyltransferase domain-containing protein [Roseibium sp. M-1]
MADFHKGFQDVDAASENEFLFRFLDDANANRSILQYRVRMAELYPPGAGMRILDIGCGLGHEAMRLAAQVGPAGKVVGIDPSNDFIREAARRSAPLRLPVSFQTGDIHALDFEDASFDLVRAERVLLYISDLGQAVSELVRVLRTGGHVTVFDFDYNAFFIDSNHGTVSRRIENLLAGDPPNPEIGRQVPELLRQAGLTVRCIEPFTITPSPDMVARIYAGAIDRGLSSGALTQEEVDDWWADQQALATAGQFYHANPGDIVVADKP